MVECKADEVIKNLAEIILTDESDLCDRTYKQSTAIPRQLKFIFREKKLKLGGGCGAQREDDL